jgi:hypothetical protein
LKNKYLHDHAYAKQNSTISWNCVDAIAMPFRKKYIYKKNSWVNSNPFPKMNLYTYMHMLKSDIIVL